MSQSPETPYQSEPPYQELLQHPVFDYATMRQEKFDQSLLIKSEHQAKFEAEQRAEELCDRVEDSDLLGQPVCVSGSDTVIMVKCKDPRLGSTYYKPIRLVDIPNSDYQSYPAISGQFRGFVGIVRREKLGSSSGWRPQLCYKVDHQPAFEPNLSGMLAATAPVSSSSIEFYSDIAHTEASDAYGRLLTGQSALARNVIGDVDRRLSEMTSPNAHDLQTIATVVSTEFLQLNAIAKLSPHQEDALLDLITARLMIYPYKAFDIEADYHFAVQADDAQPTLVEGQPIVNATILGLSCAPEGQASYGQQTSNVNTPRHLSFLCSYHSEEGVSMVEVPLAAINEFERCN